MKQQGQDVRVGKRVKIYEYPLAEKGESREVEVKKVLSFGVFENLKHYQIETKNGELLNVLSNHQYNQNARKRPTQQYY